MWVQRTAVMWVCASLVIGMAGCGANVPPEFTKAVVPVKGRVTFRGKSIPKAVITFHAVDRSIVRSTTTGTEVTPFGVVSEDGTFSVTSGVANDGAPEGEYLVTISWPSSTRESDESFEQLPPKYQDPNSSGVRVRIASGQTELPAIALN